MSETKKIKDAIFAFQPQYRSGNLGSETPEELLARMRKTAGQFVELVHGDSPYCVSDVPNAKASGGYHQYSPSQRFITVNSIKEGKPRALANVTGFRSHVIEFDQESQDVGLDVWKQKQWEYIEPFAPIISGIIWSGNKSLHCWVTYEEAIDKKIWDDIARHLRAFSPCDQQVLANGATWARYPGGLRDVPAGKPMPYQSVVYLGQRTDVKDVQKLIAIRNGNAKPEEARSDASEASSIVRDVAAKVVTGDIAGRNEGGFVLARLLRDARFSVEQARQALTQYHTTVQHVHGERGAYSLREALATLDSAFSRAPVTVVGSSDFMCIDNLCDMEMANLFIRQITGDIWYTKGLEFLAWNKERWVPDSSIKQQWEDFLKYATQQARAIPATTEDDKKYKDAVCAWVKKWGSIRCYNTAISLSKDDNRIRAEEDIFDKHLNLICCKNGVVDLQSGELRPFSRDDMITQQIATPYRPDAQCDEWDEFLQSIAPPDVIAYLQRALGYSITGETCERQIYYLYGEGKNGKTTLLEAVAGAIGSIAAKAPASILYHRAMQDTSGSASPHIAALRAAHLVVLSEVERGRKVDTAALKDLTGNDSITCRNLYSAPFTFRPKFCIWLYGNFRLEIDADDTAVRDRVKMIELRNRFEQPDRMLPRKLASPAAQEAILAWLVAGAQRWYREGIQEPEAVRTATADYMTECSPVRTFVDACVYRTVENYKASAHEIYERYLRWASSAGVDPDAQRTFFMAFGKHGFEKTMVHGKTFYSHCMVVAEGEEK